MATAWRSADRRLSGAQAELALQEENARRSKRECRATLDQMAVLERSLQATESELRASQVGRSGGPVGAGPRVLCGPVLCGVFMCLREKGLGLSQIEGFRFDTEQPAFQLSPFGWGSPVIATQRQSVLTSFWPGPGSLNVHKWWSIV